MAGLAAHAHGGWSLFEYLETQRQSIPNWIGHLLVHILLCLYQIAWIHISMAGLAAHAHGGWSLFESLETQRGSIPNWIGHLLVHILFCLY
jgi:hypothetical protein